MTAASLQIGTVTVIAAALLLWLLSSLIFRVTGVWSRMDGDEQLELAQLGPLVTGRRAIEGGHQLYSGLAVGPWVWLTRRDVGVEALEAMGFPKPIAVKLDGEVMAKLTAKRKGAEMLVSFTPRKFDFTHQPPRITGSSFLPAQQRVYRRS
jgi:hypothetical protein